MKRLAPMGCIIVMACTILTLLPGAIARAGLDLSGEWEYTFMGYRLDMQVRQQGQSVQGVAHLHYPTGAADPYHFHGIVRGARVVASHHSGHFFRGRIVSANEISGTLSTAHGRRWTMTARRR